MPKYEVTYVASFTHEVEAESVSAAHAAAMLELGLESALDIRSVIQTDPPLSTQALLDAGVEVVEQSTEPALELPPPVRPVHASFGDLS